LLPENGGMEYELKLLENKIILEGKSQDIFLETAGPHYISGIGRMSALGDRGTGSLRPHESGSATSRPIEARVKGDV
jgi:hypothetical protein